MKTVLDQLNTALASALNDDERVYLLGEDILDPYGGAFKVTRGLSSAHPQRVLTTPVSESSIVGLAAGMALRGLHPVVEIMFGDFLTLAADQLINHIAKYQWMYAGQVELPLLIRTPMGGRRGYGPTHSQTLEKLFLGVPGLRLVAPCALGSPFELLYHLILESTEPTIFIENKLLYLEQVQNTDSLPEFSLEQFQPKQAPDPDSPQVFTPPTYSLKIRGAPPPTLTIASYGYMAGLAQEAMLKLAYEMEIFAELVVVTQLAPYSLDAILDSTALTGRLLTVEEGSLTLGWGAEVLARCIEQPGSSLKTARRVAALDLPVPASLPLESAVLPGVEQIFQAACLM